MGLLYFVEEHDGIGLAADRLRQLAALLKADIAGRRADQFSRFVALHILAHVHADHRVFAAKEKFRERPRQLRLADAGRPQEEEAAYRASGVLHAASRAAHRAGHRVEGLFLPDHAVLELILHAQQSAALLLGELRHGYPRALRHNGGDIFRRYLRRYLIAGFAPLTTPLLALLLRLTFLVAQKGGFFKLLRGGGLLLLLAEVIDAAFQRLKLFRYLKGVDARARRSLVDKVYRLVGKKPVGYIAFGKRRRRLQRLVCDAHAVVPFVTVAQPFEYQHRLFLRGLVDLHRLEAALKRGVLLYILAVFVYRCGADHLELAAREARLEDVRGVDGPLGADRVDLVDEENYILGFANLLHKASHAFLKFPAVLRARNEVRHIQLHYALILEYLRDIAGENPLRQPLGDGGLADARFAYEHRVVFRAA